MDLLMISSDMPNISAFEYWLFFFCFCNIGIITYAAYQLAGHYLKKLFKI